MAEATKSGSQSGSSSSSSGGSKASAQDKNRYGGDEPLPYPEPELLDKVTYRDPRPLDWPQKADRSVYVGPVRSTDPDDDGGEKSGYVYTGKVREDEELELGSGKEIKDYQVVGGGGYIAIIVNGESTVYPAGTAGGLLSDLQEAINMVANS